MSRGRPWEAAARGSRVLLAGTVAAKAMRFATDVLLGRVLGPAAFGIVAAAMSFSFILTRFAQLGVDRGVLRFVSVHESAGDAVRSRALARRALAIPVLAGLALVTGVVLARQPIARMLFGGAIDPWILVLFAAGVPVLGFLTVLQAAARAARRYRVDTLVGDVLRNAFILAVTVGLLAAGWRLWGAAAGFTGGMLVSCAAAWWLYGKGRRAPEAAGSPRATERTGAAGAAPGERPSDDGMRALLKVSVPLAFATSAGLLVNELDKVMLAALREPTEAGLYNAAFRLARQVNVLLPSLVASLSPWVAPLIAQSRLGDLRDLYRRVNRWALCVALSAVLVCFTFGRELLALFGPGFAPASQTLTVIALGQLAVAASAGAAMILQFSGRERVELRIQTLALGLNVALNLALIPGLGAAGAATATLVVHTVSTGLRVREARRVVGVVPWDRGTVRMLGGALVSAAAAACAGIVARWIGTPAPVVVGAASVGALAGWAAFFAGGGLDRGDAALLRLPRLGRGQAARRARPMSAVLADVPGPRTSAFRSEPPRAARRRPRAKSGHFPGVVRRRPRASGGSR